MVVFHKPQNLIYMKKVILPVWRQLQKNIPADKGFMHAQNISNEHQDNKVRAGKDFPLQHCQISF